MDAYEATRVVMSRIQTLDPENASKIMGYILIQDQGEKEMIRLAFGPENLLISYISQAKACLGLGSNSPSSNPSTPVSYSIRPTNPFPPRVIIPNNGLHLSNPSSPASAFPRSSPRPFSYAAALNGSASAAEKTSSGSPSLHLYSGTDFRGQDELPFLDDSVLDPIMSPSGRSDSLVFQYGDEMNAISSSNSHPFHRRSCSVNDAPLLSNLEGGGGGFGWRPCMYFARGHCKNGSSCKFLHGEIGSGDEFDAGSPGNNSTGFDELLRMKAFQQQRLTLMAHHSFPYNKCMNDNPRSTFADEFRKCSFQKSDFSSMGLVGNGSSSSRQIYLTFPADSTFKEEDVSNYFSTFGPVQDVRIPYQQKRMFGFVTFHYPETVKHILAKGNPHFVCDSRVLVKPYKEKGKIQNGFRKPLQHQFERGDHLSCLSPSGFDSTDIDLSFGPRLLFSTQEMMLRRKLEQEAELQHVIELQGRRMMNLQLMDLKNQQQQHHHMHPFRSSVHSGAPVLSPRDSQLLMNSKFNSASDAANQKASGEFDGIAEAVKTSSNPEDQNLEPKAATSPAKKFISNFKQLHANCDDSYLPESFEHILPDNLFASPTKLAAENRPTIFTQSSADDVIPITTPPSNNNNPLMLPMASLKSCYVQMPRSH